MALKLLGKYPAIFFGSRIYLVLKVWSEGIKIMGTFEGSDCVRELYLPCTPSDRERPTREMLWGQRRLQLHGHWRVTEF